MARGPIRSRFPAVLSGWKTSKGRGPHWGRGGGGAGGGGGGGRGGGGRGGGGGWGGGGGGWGG
ncbi:hypothetical protein C9F10_23910, partial [Salmonella enterica subsp. enterica serovar Poona]